MTLYDNGREEAAEIVGENWATGEKKSPKKKRWEKKRETGVFLDPFFGRGFLCLCFYVSVWGQRKEKKIKLNSWQGFRVGFG